MSPTWSVIGVPACGAFAGGDEMVSFGLVEAVGGEGLLVLREDAYVEAGDVFEEDELVGVRSDAVGWPATRGVHVWSGAPIDHFTHHGPAPRKTEGAGGPALVISRERMSEARARARAGGLRAIRFQCASAARI